MTSNLWTWWDVRCWFHETRRAFPSCIPFLQLSWWRHQRCARQEIMYWRIKPLFRLIEFNQSESITFTTTKSLYIYIRFLLSIFISCKIMIHILTWFGVVVFFWLFSSVFIWMLSCYVLKILRRSIIFLIRRFECLRQRWQRVWLSALC